jgi:hypothetical protein
MNSVNIRIEGPVMENLGRVTIADDYDSDSFHVDFADVETARSAGLASVLDLVVENCGSGADILEAAIQNGSPVSLDDEAVPVDVLRRAFGTEGLPVAP